MNDKASRAVVRRALALLPVVATCAVSLVLLRPELIQVPYLNDSAVHEEMVRFALAKIRTGHFPPDSWFPYLNLGTPQFLQYQSLGTMVTALLAWVIGVGRAFTLTTWLLVGCWPLCVYAAARIFGLSRGAAGAAAVLSPFVSSFTGVGYEQISYLWSGYGLWSQLWAMWALPFAWALSWRAVEERRFVVPAALAVAAAAAFHFETGYLAFGAVALFVLVRPFELVARAVRACLVVAGAAALSAWAIVPLIAQGRWAAINQFLQNGPSGVDANSYGARRILAALLSGSVLDWHHLILITPLFAFGLAFCLFTWRRSNGAGPVGQATGRALVLVFLASLALFFGRPTLGPLLDLLPGSKDLFLRRFIVGVQLSCLILAGVGAAELGRLAVRGGKAILSAWADGKARLGSIAGLVVLGCVCLAVLVPAWSFTVGQADLDASLVSSQSTSTGGTKLNALVATIDKQGGGRVFAGDPTDWGDGFTVGQVQVFKYLASQGVDEVGFTLRTASLMSDPEVDFDEVKPADYEAFGISWLILPPYMQPPVPAVRVERQGDYVLWRIVSAGYVQVVDTRGAVSATSSDLGSFAATFLPGLSSNDPIFPTVAYGSGQAAPGTLLPGKQPTGPPGQVISERPDLANGLLKTTVSVTRNCVVLLSVSYNTGWQVTVDGRASSTEMVAPALIGVRVGPGMHTLRFVYRGFPDYPQLFVLGGMGLIGLIVIERRRKVRV